MTTKTIGNKLEVWKGIAKKTSGGLTINMLAKSKSGKIVSKKKQAQGRAIYKKNKLTPLTGEELAKLRKK